MNAIDHLSPASAEALALLTGQSGSGALAAPALDLVQRFRSALGGESEGEQATGCFPSGLLDDGVEEGAVPAPFGLLSAPQSDDRGASPQGEDSLMEPLELQPQDAASLMQALLPWLPAWTSFAEGRLGLAPSVSGHGIATTAVDAFPTEASHALRETVARVLDEASDPLAPQTVAGDRRSEPFDTAAFLSDSTRLLELLPRVASDGPMRAMLGTVGLTPERLGAWLPSLQSSATDPAVVMVISAARDTAGWGRENELSRASSGAAVAEDTPVTLGTTLLQSLASQSAGAAAAVSAPTAPTVAHIAALQDMVAETVSRVLVSDPLHDGRREVRISLANDVLPNTEIRLWRQENRLHVEFVTTASVADGGLQEGLPRLAEAIQQRQPQSELPLLSVRLADGSGNPEDGRSRQRYLTPEELEDGA